MPTFTETFVTKFSVLTCSSCGVKFAITEELENASRKHGKTFYCPNGDSQWFGESEAASLKKQLIASQAAHDQSKAALATAERQRDEKVKELATINARVTNGVCSQCNRSFTNLRRHMATKHKH